MTKLFLIRHARSAPEDTLPEVEWPLSKLGEEQAVRLADRLADQGIDRIISSPYRRAVDTVQPLAARLGLDVELVEALRERRLAPGWQHNWEEVLQKSWADFSFALPGGESNFSAQARMRVALHDIAAVHAGRTIAAASHGTAIGMFLNSLDPAFGIEDWRAIKNPHVFELSWTGTQWRRNDA